MMPGWISKCKFFYSDTLRYANIAVRKCSALGMTYAERVWQNSACPDHFAYAMAL